MHLFCYPTHTVCMRKLEVTAATSDLIWTEDGRDDPLDIASIQRGADAAASAVPPALAPLI
jgi:hypothetical protein